MCRLPENLDQSLTSSALWSITSSLTTIPLRFRLVSASRANSILGSSSSKGLSIRDFFPILARALTIRFLRFSSRAFRIAGSIFRFLLAGMAIHRAGLVHKSLCTRDTRGLVTLSPEKERTWLNVRWPKQENSFSVKAIIIKCCQKHYFEKFENQNFRKIQGKIKNNYQIKFVYFQSFSLRELYGTKNKESK